MITFSFQRARLNKGLSIRALGTLLGVSKSMVAKMEAQNHVPAERVLDVAEVLAIRPGLIRPDIYPRTRFKVK